MRPCIFIFVALVPFLFINEGDAQFMKKVKERAKGRRRNKVKEGNDVEVFKTDEGYESSAGSGKVAAECGGDGKLHGFTVDGCELIESPCDVPANNESPVFELVFTPSEDIKKLKHKMEVRTAKLKSFNTLYENYVEDSGVEKGELTTVANYCTKMDKNWKGKRISLRYTIFKNNEIETCAQVDLNMT